MNQAAQLRAAVRSLFPDEMTPHARRILENIANQWDGDTS
jgi:hypothetical protein